MQPDSQQPPASLGLQSNVPTISQPVPNQPYNTSQPAVSYPSALQAATPQLAEDTDLIEEEWVSAAKRIISENKQNPFAQNEAMNLLRKDYMKKRYGENIKAAN